MKISPRRLITALAALCLGIGAALGLIAAPAQAAGSATTEQTFLTFYGWWDNTPPGGDISYPQIHQTAGGTGTYADPITFATDSSEQPPGTIVYVPRVGKYFIMEDGCEECSSDWNGHGPNGGPNLRHLDLWLGGKGGNAFDAIECEDALTNYNTDGTPSMEPVIVNPPSNETVTLLADLQHQHRRVLRRREADDHRRAVQERLDRQVHDRPEQQLLDRGAAGDGGLRRHRGEPAASRSTARSCRSTTCARTTRRRRSRCRNAQRDPASSGRTTPT